MPLAEFIQQRNEADSCRARIAEDEEFQNVGTGQLRGAAAALDSEAWGHWAMAGCDMISGHRQRGVARMLRAIELNPDDADIVADT